MNGHSSHLSWLNHRCKIECLQWPTRAWAISSLAKRSTIRMKGKGWTRTIAGGYICWTWASIRSPRYQYLPWPHLNNTWWPFSSWAHSHSACSSHSNQGSKDIWKSQRTQNEKPNHIAQKENNTKKKPLTKQKISPKKKKPHIIDNQIINHHTPNLQRTLGRHWQTILGQPTKKPGIHITNIC